nr:4147_t:CDS:10 [Entrophospora candida]
MNNKRRKGTRTTITINTRVEENPAKENLHENKQQQTLDASLSSSESKENEWAIYCGSTLNIEVALVLPDYYGKCEHKRCEVSARIRDIEAKRIVADKHLLMNERSRNVLNETIEEHNKASEALSDFANVEYNVRKKRKQNHQSDRYTSPSPPSPKLRNLPIELSKFTDNLFLEEERVSEADDVIAIDDIPYELSFEHEDLVNEFFLGKTNVSQLFRIYQSESIRIAKDGAMIDIFGSPLLDKIYKELMPIQQIAMLRKAIKMANKLSDDATNWLCTQLANKKTLRDSAGFVIFDCLRMLPMSKIRSEHSETTHITNYLDRIMRGFFNNPNQHVVQWPNTALDESKARKIEGRNSLDSAIDKGADIKIIGFQCIGFKLDFYIMDLTHGIYTMVHFGQVMFPASIKEMAAFVDEMETLLRIQEIFYESFNILYAKFCAPTVHSGLDVSNIL